MGMYWRQLAGDTSVFAVELALISDDDANDDVVSFEERVSWGALSIWVEGENLTLHSEQGEELFAAHWYLLPILEWVVARWDAIFNEQRLPDELAGTDAAQAGERVAERLDRDVRAELIDIGVLDPYADWQRWFNRHALQAAAPGAVLPDLFLRRLGDKFEISLGTSRQHGILEGLTFKRGPYRAEIELEFAAKAMMDVVEGATRELSRRHPGSVRFCALAEQLDAIRSADRRYRQMAWLAGMGEEPDRFKALVAEVEEAFASRDDMDTADQLLTLSNHDDNLTLEAPPLALLFGALSPSITREDQSAVIVDALLTLTPGESEQRLNRTLRGISPEPHKSFLRGTPAGEQGSVLGDAAWTYFQSELAHAEVAAPVDIERILRFLNIDVGKIRLSDTSIRAISLVTPNRDPRILVNSTFRRGGHERIFRFTLAHELAHLIFDRSSAAKLAIASGPWAPLALEQRANAFAAALLMPTPVIYEYVAQAREEVTDLDSVVRLATYLNVSLTSLLDRLANVGILSRWHANDLLDELRGNL